MPKHVFWPVFSRKLKHKTAKKKKKKKIWGNVNYIKLSLYTRNQQFFEQKKKKNIQKSCLSPSPSIIFLSFTYYLVKELVRT